VQRLLDAHPGAFYLRTDQTCPSLRPATEDGDPIYAVFDLGGITRGEVCAAVRAAGGNAYGKWLDAKTDPGYIISC
jgi:serine/threonine-protein kinase